MARTPAFVITVTALSCAFSACGGSTSGDGAGGSGGSSCPTALPASGTACAGPAECHYDGCPPVVARCETGVWERQFAGSCNPPPPEECPASRPAHGTSCSLPSGTSCDFGDCCPFTSTCVDGTWDSPSVSCNPPAPPPCPELPPADGASCAGDACSNTFQECFYGDCGGQPDTTATCDGLTWKVVTTPCAPCEGLSACECFDRPDCQAVSDSCICPCDYQCPGDPPCDCVCGGGTYLGCKAL